MVIEARSPCFSRSGVQNPQNATAQTATDATYAFGAIFPEEGELGAFYKVCWAHVAPHMSRRA